MLEFTSQRIAGNFPASQELWNTRSQVCNIAACGWALWCTVLKIQIRISCYQLTVRRRLEHVKKKNVTKPVGINDMGNSERTPALLALLVAYEEKLEVLIR